MEFFYSWSLHKKIGSGLKAIALESCVKMPVPTTGSFTARRWRHVSRAPTNHVPRAGS